METKLNHEIRTVLEKFDSKYIIDGIINKNQVIRDLDQYDAELVAEILTNEELKKRFTLNVAGATIIKVNDFIEVFEQDEYWQDSYTKYSKKIGLTINGKFLDETSEVVLDFPYKDTVLKASMSKEDNDKSDLKPDEPFLNEVIAQYEIDTLLDKKIFVNTKRYTAEGEEEIENFDNDNLIIKGNNLLALHTLKEKYSGKVKLIYIDPPYNTGGDSFNYNDRFNQSTWLTFMKNRLEIAYDLLSSNGSIWINIDQNGVHYLKVLADQVFVKGFVADVAWQKRTSPDFRNPLGDAFDHILVYSKDVANFKGTLNTLPLTKEQISKYKNPDNDPRGEWVSTDFTAQGYRPNQMYKITTPSGKEYSPSPGNCWKRIESEYIKLRDEGRIWFGNNGDAMPRRKTYLKESPGIIPWTWWSNKEAGHNQEAKKESIALFGKESSFSTPKPERLLQRLISISTNEGDIILDFFMGSATTQSVAMKMNRKFIGIEQMDYINTISVPRLQKVIEGEQGGISKDVNWQGGSSFVYAELMEKNTGFIKEIINAQNMIELQVIFKRMMETADFDFRVNLTEIQKDDLWQQSLDDQKRILIKVIDKNQLYYNYSEIDDENVRNLISDNDYAFNKSFYADRGE